MYLERSKETIEKIKLENKEFRNFFQKHQEFEKRLQEIDKMHYLDAEMEIERKKIQKMKLSNREKLIHILDQFEKK